MKKYISFTINLNTTDLFSIINNPNRNYKISNFTISNQNKLKIILASYNLMQESSALITLVSVLKATSVEINNKESLIIIEINKENILNELKSFYKNRPVIILSNTQKLIKILVENNIINSIIRKEKLKKI